MTCCARGGSRPATDSSSPLRTRRAVPWRLSFQTNTEETMQTFEYHGQQWQEEYEELYKRRKMAQAMGGEQALLKHKERGRLNARERMDALLDPGSFREMGRLAGKGRYDESGRFID